MTTQTCENTNCQNTATVVQYDCCDFYNFPGYFCSDCSWEGGSTQMCEWENQDLNGNVLAGNML